jgi:hypothetical protein
MSRLNLPKPDKQAYYVCIENHTSDRGTVREGDRLRGDHPDVQTDVLWWVPENLDTEQRYAERMRRRALVYPIDDIA